MTPHELLHKLRSEEWDAEIVASTPSGLRRILHRRVEVRELRNAYASGCLDQEEIRSFVDELIRDGGATPRFPYQTALAAIAVMLEPCCSPFAEEYLRDLAAIRSTRFTFAAGVARDCKSARTDLIHTSVRDFVCGTPSTSELPAVSWESQVVEPTSVECSQPGISNGSPKVVFNEA